MESNTTITGNILPVLPEGGKIDLTPYWHSNKAEFHAPRYLLEYKGVGFSPLGGVQALCGRQKHGKSMVASILIAAVLNSNSERVRAKLPDLRTKEETLQQLDHETSVLYIDTEMEEGNTTMLSWRAQWLCGWDVKEDYPRFKRVRLRDVEENMVKREIAFAAIEEMRPTFVIIDGLRDLIDDFNDLKASARLINQLMIRASKYNCCIWCVLHQNPSNIKDFCNKMRGHLGTELANKVTDTFGSIKEKKNGMVTFKLEQIDARGKDVQDVYFEITDEFGGIGIPRFCSTQAGVPSQDSIEDIERWLREGRDDIAWPATKEDIKTIFKQRGNVKANDRLAANVTAAINRRLIVAQTPAEYEKGQKHPKYHYNIDEEDACAF